MKKIMFILFLSVFPQANCGIREMVSDVSSQLSIENVKLASKIALSASIGAASLYGGKILLSHLIEFTIQLLTKAKVISLVVLDSSFKFFLAMFIIGVITDNSSSIKRFLNILK